MVIGMGRQRRRNQRQRQQSTADSFGMVVAARPEAGVTVAPELALTKAALLYGDTVTLLSPATTMLLRVEALGGFSIEQLLALVREVAPYLLDADEAHSLERGLPQLEEVLHSTARDRSVRARALRAGVMRKLEPMRERLRDSVDDICRAAGIDQLARAQAQGLVRIESFDPGSAVDLLAYCLIAAKLAETGQRPEARYTDRLAETFVTRLSNYLSSGRDYLIFDENVASLTEAAIREGLFTPASGASGRSAQAMTASALMGRLPTFPDATVDEVLDIRTQLVGPLTGFRSAMVTVAKDFTSEAWEKGFEDDVHDAWVQRIAPALQSIEEQIRGNRSLLAMAAGVADTATASYPGLAIVGAGMLDHVGAASAVGGALAAGAPLLQALRDRRVATSQIKMQPFYFLYATDRALGHH
jgi:ElaB/YqjD/DUF883 family membrane-anchored ribosome-binding protein